jgi:hypothetical protein
MTAPPWLRGFAGAILEPSTAAPRACRHLIKPSSRRGKLCNSGSVLTPCETTSWKIL